MPNYLTDIEIWKALWPLILFPFLVAVVICLIFGERPFRQVLSIVFALSLLGLVTGQVTGFSRVSAVGTVLPAVLSLLGGLMLYLIGTKGRRLQAPVVMGVIGLTANLLVGIYWGARSRGDYEADQVGSVVLSRQAVAKETARYTAALEKLLHDKQYEELKSALETDQAR